MSDMDIVVCAQLLVLLVLANGAPVIGKRLLGDRWACPIDAGLKLPDGAPLLGGSKTVRGVALALAATTAGAPLLGLTWQVGALVGVAAMLGDMLSSFLKRRLHMEPSSRATGLDQIPEALLPALASQEVLRLGLAEVVSVTAAFAIGDILLSRLLFRLRIRERPY
jgi:CDP-2,3-bis-(O-geranylgeranyl)-sn-glycerol synthase